MTRDQLLTAPDTALPTLRGTVTGLPCYVPGRRSAGTDIAALASNESHYEPLPAAAAAVTAAAGTMNRYPDMAAVELRERLATHLGVTSGGDRGGARQRGRPPADHYRTVRRRG
jgi:histidinol-phosphate aminotransferase